MLRILAFATPFICALSARIVVREAYAKNGKVSPALKNGFSFCLETFSKKPIALECIEPGAKYAAMKVNGKTVQSTSKQPFMFAGKYKLGAPRPWKPPSTSLQLGCITNKGKIFISGSFKCGPPKVSNKPAKTAIIVREARVSNPKKSAPLTNGFSICPIGFSKRGISLECVAPGATYADMKINWRTITTDNIRPFTSHGDKNGIANLWKWIPIGKVTVGCKTDTGAVWATGVFACNSTDPPPPQHLSAPPLVGSGQWHTVPFAGDYVPQKRHEGCAVFAAGKVYSIGGRGWKPVDVFNPSTRVWEKKGVPPLEMHHMQCVAIGKKIYAPGAWQGRYPNETPHQKMWVYNTETDKWTTDPYLSGDRLRGSAAVGVRNGKIYVAAGSTGGHGPTTKLRPYFDVYNPKTKKWAKLPNIPNGRDHVGAAVVRNYFCVAGGRDGSSANFWGSPISPINCYNFATGKWETGGNLPVGRGGSSTSATCQGLVMIAGGEGRPRGRTKGGKAFARVDLYNPKTKKFLPPSSLVTGRHGTGAAAVPDCKCGNIYLPAGSKIQGSSRTSELTDMEVWSPDGKMRNC